MISKLTFYNNLGWDDETGEKGPVSVEIDGDPYVLSRIEGLGVPNFSYSSVPYIDQPGAYFSGHSLRSRSLRLSGFITGATPSGYMENRRDFYKVLTGIYSNNQFPGENGFDPQDSALKGELELSGPGADGSGTLTLEFFGSVVSQFDSAIGRGFTTSTGFDLELLLHDPRLYEVADAGLMSGEMRARYQDDNNTFTPTGNYMTFPIYKLHGPFTAITISHMSMSLQEDSQTVQFTITHDVASDEEVIIDTFNRTVELNDGTSIYGSFSGDWFGLLPSRNNVLNIDDPEGTGANSHLRILWQNTYISI